MIFSKILWNLSNWFFFIRQAVKAAETTSSVEVRLIANSRSLKLSQLNLNQAKST